MNFSVIKSIHLILLLSFIQAAYGIEFDIDGKTRTRYRDESSKNRLQENLLLRFELRTDGGFKIVGIAQNGDSFNNIHDTVYNSSLDNEFETAEDFIRNFSYRNFYMSKKFKDGVVVQAGALEVDGGLAKNTALDSGGWIDGARIKLNTAFGEVTVTGGFLGDPNQTDAFQRSHELEYFEVKLSGELFKNLLAEFAYEIHDGTDYMRIATEYDIERASEKLITLIAEAIKDIDHQYSKTSFGAKADLMKLITGNSSGVIFEVRHSHMSDDFGDRGTTYASGFGTSKGHYGSLKISKKIGNKKDTTIYFRVKHQYKSNENRYEVGLEYKFSLLGS